MRRLMSLVVSTFWRDPATGDTQEFTDWDDGRSLVGVLRARWESWGPTPSGGAGRGRTCLEHV